MDKAKHLYAISKTPQDAWLALVEHMIDHSWSVKECERQVASLNEIVSSIPDWYPIDVSTITNIALTDDKLAKQLSSAMKEATRAIEGLNTDQPIRRRCARETRLDRGEKG